MSSNSRSRLKKINDFKKKIDTESVKFIMKKDPVIQLRDDISTMSMDPKNGSMTQKHH